MKKIIFPLLVILLIYGLAFAQTNPIPAPFEKAKEYALTGTKNSRGIWGLEFEGNINGRGYRFGFYYAEVDGSIAIFGNWEDEFVGVGTVSGNYLMASPIGIVIIDEKGATELGFKVIRKMVELNLL